MIMRLEKRERSFARKSATGGLILAVGALFLVWLLNTPEGLLGKADAVGYAVCHQIDVRSFSMGDRQFSFCARCSGMYLAAILGLFYQRLIARRRGGMPIRTNQFILGIFVIAFAVDGLNSFASLIPGLPTLYEPQNWIRLLTGTGMGLVVASVLFPIFNQTAWSDWNPRPALDSLTKMIVMIGLACLLSLLLLSQVSWILYPLALLSAASVLVILTLVYAMLILIVLRKENGYQNIVQLGLFLIGGFGVAMLQIALLDLIRYFLTGTWDGFHLG